MPPETSRPLMSADIGNSRMKLGLFLRPWLAPDQLPEPDATFDLGIAHDDGAFDERRLEAFVEQHDNDRLSWRIASVHRAAAERLRNAIAEFAGAARAPEIKQITFRDVQLAIAVERPERVGIDRLLGALAANRMRRADRAAIIIDLGTAITVDLLQADGTFAGGAILPGIATAAKALAEHTDALPNIGLEQLEQPPSALGRSTASAIEAGLYWGSIGAIRELVAQLSADLPAPPELFLTGGASSHVADILAHDYAARIHYVPHLVLAGIDLVDP